MEEGTAGPSTDNRPCPASNGSGTDAVNTALSWPVCFGHPAVYWLIGHAAVCAAALFTWAFFLRPVADYSFLRNPSLLTKADLGPSAPAPSFLEALHRYDAAHYTSIARFGYRPPDPQIAFYPLYPMLMRVLSLTLFRDLGIQHVHLSGLLISLTASLLGVILLERLCRESMNAPSRHLCLLLWVLNPAAVFLSMCYTEALFTALVIGGMLCVRRRSWLGAGTFIGLACLTRPVGVLAYVGMLLEYASRNSERGQGRNRWLDLFGLCLPALMILAHLGFQAVLYSDPLASVHAERENWGQRLVGPWAYPFYVAVTLTSAAVGLQYKVVVGVNFLLLMGGIVLTARVFSSPVIPISLRSYTALTTLSIVCRSSTMSISRMLMPAFPLFMVLAEWCMRGTARRGFGTVVTFLVLDIFGTAAFVGDRKLF